MRTLTIHTLLFAGTLLLVGGIMADRAASATTAPQDEITIQGKKPARFMHKVHTDMGLSCSVCHHDNSHQPLSEEAIGAMTDTAPLKCVTCHNSEFPVADLRKAKDVFHARCKTCHQEGYQGKNGPAKCGDCHIKKKKGYEGC